MNLASLRVRLALAGLVMVLTVTFGAWVGLSLLFDRHVERWAAAELRSQIDLILSDIRIGENGRVQLAREPSEPRFSEPFSGRYWQVAHGDQRPVFLPGEPGNKKDAFREAHRSAGDARGVYRGHPVFEGFEVVSRLLPQGSEAA